MKRMFAGLFVFMALVVGGVVIAPHAHAAPATFTVTNTDDLGAGSLRQAIIDANGNANPSDMDRIEFNISGGGVKLFSPATSLPDITQKVTVDASTQPGASCNPRTILVRLDGSSLASGNGLAVIGTNGSGSVIKGFSITNFPWRGLRVIDSDNNTFTCNNLGVQEDGSTIGGNDETGVSVEGTSSGNVIGGSTESDRNVISGNSVGVAFYQHGDNSFVYGNYIGVDASGTVAKPNTYMGVAVAETVTGNDIGGVNPGEGNVISGNGSEGVQIDQTSSDTVVQGNYIGTNPDGSSAIPNANSGVQISGSSTLNLIGGSVAGARNVIAGNGDHGVALYGSSSENTVQGNHIGINAAGTTAIPNLDNGIIIAVSSTNNLIGGSAAGERNVIAGNGSLGIGVYSGSNTIQGNYIGTNADGVAAVPNTIHGIDIAVNAVNTIIGGSQSGEGNLISGNTEKGIQIYAGANTIQGNFIGTTASGNATLGNGMNGVEMGGTANGTIIGGVNALERNVIAGNGGGAINFETNNNEIYGNYIGLGNDGATKLPNETGIVSYGGVNNTIGGPLPGQRNVIAATENFPMVVLTGFSGGDNIVQGNYIGTNAAGQPDPSNTNGPGVVVAGYQANNLIGGTGPGEGNLIAGVRGAGVTVQSVTIDLYSLTASPLKNAVLGNSIAAVEPFSFLNLDLANQAIDLGGYVDSSDPVDGFPDSSYDGGPNPNDSSDADSGANGYINTPVLKTAQQIGDQLTITYDLDAADSPSNTYRVEFFANNEATIFGAGPGEEYLGAATAATSGTNKTITLTVSGDQTNKALSATTTAIDVATDSGFGSTSEFARNISIGSAADFDADGVPDSVEDLGPNNGDGNNDGTPDRLQPTITTYEIDSTGIYATFIAEGCSENGTVASIDITSLPVRDEGKIYPYGLTDFTLNCSRGDTVDITMYIHTDSNPNQYVPRKYNATTQTFFDIPGSTLTNEQVGTSSALKLSYSITDGGDLDDDGEANGVIVDPVGLAATATGGLSSIGGLLASTGENLWLFIGGIVILLTIGFGLTLTRRKL